MVFDFARGIARLSNVTPSFAQRSNRSAMVNRLSCLGDVKRHSPARLLSLQSDYIQIRVLGGGRLKSRGRKITDAEVA